MANDNIYLSRRGAIKVSGAALGGALLLAACGGSSTTTTAGGATTTTGGSTTTLGGATTTTAAGATTTTAAMTTVDDLIAASQAEGGSLVWYLPGSTDMADALKAAFTTAYPWTQPEVQSLAFRDLPNKLITERITGAPTADVYMLPAAFRQLMMDNDVNAPTEPLPAEADLPQDLLDPDGFSHPVYLLLISAIYNTNSLPDGPPKPEEMVNPEWLSRMAFDRVQNLGQSTLWLSSWKVQWGDAEWINWLQGLAANDILVTGSGGDTYAAVLRGERDFGLGASNDIGAQEPGTPVAADYTYPPVPFVQNLWMTNGAANPATAALFMNWCLSADGQEALASTGRTPVLQSIDSPVSLSNILPSGVQPMPGDQLFDFYNNASNYVSLLGQYWPG